MNTKSLMCTIIKRMSLRKTVGFDILVLMVLICRPHQILMRMQYILPSLGRTRFKELSAYRS